MKLQALDDAIESDSSLEALLPGVLSIHKKISDAPKLGLAITDVADIDTLAALIAPEQSPSDHFTAFHYTAPLQARHEIWKTQTDSNYCAKSYTGVAESHADSAALKLLASLLTGEYLRRAIRESGGAYGGGASYEIRNGVFNFYSYRDPRHLETITDFDHSIDWIMKADINAEMLNEAKLTVIGAYDKPGTPAAEASKAFLSELQGRNLDSVIAFRQAVLKVEADDVRRVAATYLKPEEGSIAIVASARAADEIVERVGDGFEVFSV